MPSRICCLFFVVVSIVIPPASSAQPPVEDLGRRSQTMLARIAATSPSLAMDWNEEGIRVLDAAGRVTVWDPSLGHPVRSRRVVPSRRPAPTSATEAAERVREEALSPEQDSLLRAFDFEGQWLALALEGFVTSWNLETLERQGRYERPGESLTAIAIDAEGQWMASGDGDGWLCVWRVDAEEGTPQCVALSAEDGAIGELEFLGDGRLAVGQQRRVTVGHLNGGLWSAEGAVPLMGPEGSELRAFSEVAGQLLIGWSNGQFDVRDVENGSIFSTGLGSEPLATTAAPTGDWLAVLAADGVSILGCQAGVPGWSQESQISAGNTPFRAVAFDPDGSRLATTDATGLITTWAVDSRLRLRSMRAHGQRVGSVRWASPQELWTVVPSRYAVYAWNVPENLATVWVGGDRLATTGRGVPSTAVASPDGGRVAIGFEDGGVALWDRRELFSGDPVAVWQAHGGTVREVAFASVSEGGEPVLLTGGDDRVRWWQAVDGAEVEPAGGNASWDLGTPIRHLGLSSFERVAALGTDQGILLRSLETGEEIASVDLGQPVFASRFASQKELVLAAADGLYSWQVGAQPERFQDFGRGVRVFDFAPASRALASAKASNGAVEIWTFEDDGRLMPIHLLLSGDRGRWIACEKEGTCRRNDDGTLLLDRELDEAYQAMLPALGTTPALEVVEVQRTQGDDGITSIEVTVRNQGPGPTAWVRLRPSQPLDPTRFATPETLPWLAEGSQATLTAEVGPLDESEQGEIEVEVIAATASARDGVVAGVRSRGSGFPLTAGMVLGGLFLAVAIALILRRSGG